MKAEISALYRSNGMGEKDPQGSYVTLSVSEGLETVYHQISEGAAVALINELRAILGGVVKGGAA